MIRWVMELIGPLLQPRVIVVEYNANIPPPGRFVMPYKADHLWSGDDYYGASLGSWVGLLDPLGYRLVACSYMGNNAFFVREPGRAFDDVPRDVTALYRPALYLDPVNVSHPRSPRTLETIERS